MEKPASLGSELYDRDYYLKSLPGIEHLERKDAIDPAIFDTVRLGGVKSGDDVLDFGCGRGALAIELAKRGVRALGIDFSQDAISFARSFVKQFPKDIQDRVDFRRMTIEEFAFERSFNVIVFNQVFEHLHDWELGILLPKFKRALKPDGMLVISTPNLNYIRFLYPLKRTTEFPFKILKELLRLARGKSKHAGSLSSFLREIFKIRYPESEHTRLHINLQTPAGIRRALERQGFQAQAECVDSRADLLSLVMKRWWGETIWLTGTVKNQTAQAQL